MGIVFESIYKDFIMKKIFKYFSILLSVALMGALSACTVKENLESADAGLGIKVFSPTKVVAGQPMTINGSGFADVKEIVFPDNVVVTNFQIVSGEMIRVTAPAGISAEGGKLVVSTDTEKAESKTALTLGKTIVSGFDKQEGESVAGLGQLTIYGKDLEFVSSVELMDTEGNVLAVINDTEFYRRGTSFMVITLPKKMSDDNLEITGKINTLDGQIFALPRLAYEPASDGGHWETVETVIWENDDPAGHGAISWSGVYRFALEGTDVNSEAIAEIPADTWEKMKTTPFYMTYTPADPTSYQIRVTTGWWSVQWLGADNDIAPWNMADRIVDNEDGTYTIAVDFNEDPAILASIDEQHLLFTGNGYTPLKICFREEVWVDGGGHMEIVKTSIWKNDDPAGHGAISWSGVYRFALEGTDVNSEAIAEIPQETWDKMMSSPFYMMYTAADPTSYQVRVTTGWWSVQWLGADNDIAPWNMADRIIDNEDGTFSIMVDFSEDPAILASIEEQHLLFTGNGYTVLELYFQEEVWVGGGGSSTPKEVLIWENTVNSAVSWSSVYRFATEGHETGEEIAIIPADVWEKVKTNTFYLDVEATDPQIRVTTGWWDPNFQSEDFQPGNDQLTDNGDGTWTLEVNISGNADFVAAIDERHLLFTGDRFTPTKWYFLE